MLEPFTAADAERFGRLANNTSREDAKAAHAMLVEAGLARWLRPDHRLAAWWHTRIGNLKEALRQWLGIADAEAALTTYEARIQAASAELHSAIAAWNTEMTVFHATLKTIAENQTMAARHLAGHSRLLGAWQHLPLLKQATARAAAAQERARKQQEALNAKAEDAAQAP